MSESTIGALFCDIGGVVLTNGWDTATRRRAIMQFDLEADAEDVEARHALYFPLYELGNFSLDTYLEGVIFYRRRSFSRQEFLDFMHAQSHADTAMLAILRRLKLCRPDIKLVTISNEGAELARYRAQKFYLGKIFDAYLVSGFVHMRKPEVAFYQLGLDIVQLAPQEVVYLEDRPIFVDVATRLGIKAYLHSNASETALYLEKELALVEGALQLPQ